MTYVTDQDKKQIHKKYAQFKLQEEFRLTKQNSRIGQDKNIYHSLLLWKNVLSAL